MGDYTDPGDEQPYDPEVALEEAWQILRLIALGFKASDASELAALGVSWHDAEYLILTGCPPRLARRILLPA